MEWCRLPQAALASLSLLLILPVTMAVSRTATMLPNCKALLMLSLLTRVWLVANHLLFSLVDFFIGRPDPSDLDDHEQLFMMSCALAFSISSMLSLFHCIERAWAMANISSYSSSPRLSTSFIVTAIALSFSFALRWSFYAIVDRRYIECILIMMVVEGTAGLSSFVSYGWSRRVYGRSLGRVSLAERYQARQEGRLPMAIPSQMAEILEYTRCVLPIIAISSLLKAAALGPPLAWQFGPLTYSHAKTTFNTLITLNSSICCLLLLNHRGIKRHWQRIFSSSRMAVISVSIGGSSSEADHHFEMLKSIWR